MRSLVVVDGGEINGRSESATGLLFLKVPFEMLPFRSQEITPYNEFVLQISFLYYYADKTMMSTRGIPLRQRPRPTTPAPPRRWRTTSMPPPASIPVTTRPTWRPLQPRRPPRVSSSSSRRWDSSTRPWSITPMPPPHQLRSRRRIWTAPARPVESHQDQKV